MSLFDQLSGEPFCCEKIVLAPSGAPELALQTTSEPAATLFVGQLPMGTTPDIVERMLYAVARHLHVPVTVDTVSMKPQTCTCAFAKMNSRAATVLAGLNKQFVLDGEAVWLAPSQPKTQLLTEFMCALPKDPLKPRAKKPIVIEIAPDKRHAPHRQPLVMQVDGQQPFQQYHSHVAPMGMKELQPLSIPPVMGQFVGMQQPQLLYSQFPVATASGVSANHGLISPRSQSFSSQSLSMSTLAALGQFQTAHPQQVVLVMNAPPPPEQAIHAPPGTQLMWAAPQPQYPTFVLQPPPSM